MPATTTGTEAYLELRDADVHDQVRAILIGDHHAGTSLTDRAWRAISVLWDHVQRTEPLRSTAADLASAWGEYQSLADRLGSGTDDVLATDQGESSPELDEVPVDNEAPTTLMEPIGIDDTTELDEVAW